MSTPSHHFNLGALLSLGLIPLLLGACPSGQCIDDGFAGGQSLEACDDATATATMTTTGETETESASASISASASATVTVTATDSTTSAGSVSESATMGTTTNGDGELWCVDADGDGFGDPDNCMPAIPGEDPPEGYVVGGEDCDDSDPNTYPGAAEKDDPEACMTDADGDGYGDSMPSNPDVTPGTDCDDSDPLTYPGAAFNEDPQACMTDADGDGWGESMPNNPGVTPGTDCDDSDPFTYPGAAANEDPEACMRDEDGDGWGDAQVPPGVTPGADCFDSNADLNPGEQILFAFLTGGDVAEVSRETGALSVFSTINVLGLEGEWSSSSASVSPENGLTYVANASQNRLTIVDYCDEGQLPVELAIHGRSVCGIAFDAEANLYGIDSGADELLLFNTETGSIEVGLPITLDDELVNITACGMAFDCHSGQLLVSEAPNKRLLYVDPATGIASVAASIDDPPGAGMAYDAIGRLALSNSLKQLYAIMLDGSNTAEFQSELDASVNDLDFGPICQ